MRVFVLIVIGLSAAVSAMERANEQPAAQGEGMSPNKIAFRQSTDHVEVARDTTAARNVEPVTDQLEKRKGGKGGGGGIVINENDEEGEYSI